MTTRTSRTRTKRASAVKTMPINFRMPRELRERMRTFAQARHLSESEALRLIVADHLDEIESERELSEGERWQFKQAYETWQRFRRGEGHTVTSDEIQRAFDQAREKVRAAQARPHARPTRASS